ncbi:MAG: Putative oxidoreductase [uncultured Thermomicrobiales bacterium]|uniref:Oxidoreductase n=1 Tax=uncultured Thermomicrobiales bacterium TaxID=1645740 RepID=A0A6J4U9Q3_9BACT|nr:MAG: Putative oxidoreductase [uncultured Thermomicrobiales bacterium]
MRRLAAELDAAYPRIDVIANNAGGIFSDSAKTVDGFEKTFQINHLAPFLLTGLLMDKLTASNSTVIQTSSIGSRMAGKLDLEDLDNERDFNALRAYNAAKLENILFTKELHRRYHDQGVSAAAFYPGNIATSFGSETDSRIIKFIATNPIARSILLTTPDKGVDQLVWLAETRPGVEWQSGNYYEKRKPAKRINPQALDADLARELWERSQQLIGDPIASSGR